MTLSGIEPATFGIASTKCTTA